MSNNDSNNKTKLGLNSKSTPETVYTRGRTSLLFLVIFTIVNFVLFFINGSYFLVSVFLPYFIVMIGAISSGVIYYEGNNYAGFEPLGIPALIISLVFGLLILLLYFICWLLSKKRSGWLVTALVLFSFDTLFLLFFVISGGSILSGFLDILFHGLVIYELIAALIAWNKIKNKPKEPVIEAGFSEISDDNCEQNKD